MRCEKSYKLYTLLSMIFRGYSLSNKRIVKHKRQRVEEFCERDFEVHEDSVGRRLKTKSVLTRSLTRVGSSFSHLSFMLVDGRRNTWCVVCSIALGIRRGKIDIWKFIYVRNGFIFPLL